MSEPDPASSPTSEQDTAQQRHNYSVNIGLVLVVVVVMGGAMLIAVQLDLGAAVIIAGFTAIFFSLGVGGGALRADLRKVAWYGPLTALSASVPRILTDYDRWLALALVCLIIFVAGLLPALGRNHTQAGLGLGIVTLLTFALQTPTGTPGQTVAAAVVGVAFVVLLRILLKLRDPGDVTRELAAATLTDNDPDFGQAYLMWLRDKPVRWLGESLHAAVGYRAIHATLTPEQAATAEVAARRVSALVTARRPEKADAIEPPKVDTAAELDPPTGRLSQVQWALHRIATAARHRDTTVAGDAAVIRRAFSRAALRSVLTWRSQVLRHAIRTTVGVFLTFMVAWATVGPQDPLVVSMAVASFAMLQISWTQSLFKAKQRVIGVACGAAVMALVLWIVPQPWLLPIAVLAAASGLWFIASNQTMAIASFVLVSVGLNTVTRDLDPVHTLIEYVLLLFAAVVCGLLLGFVVIPHVRPRPLKQRVHQARQAVIELLRSTAGAARTSTGTDKRRTVVSDALRGPLHRLLTEVANLRSPLNRSDERMSTSTLDRGLLATRFETLGIIAVLEAGQQRLDAATLTRAAAILQHPSGQRDTPAPDTPDFEQFTAWVAISADSAER